MTATHHDQPMPRCREAEGLIACAADGAGLAAEETARLSRHLDECAACRAALEEQRAVARIIQARPGTPVPPGFHTRLAARLGGEAGILGLANWRAWTVGLLPVAGGLVLMAYFGIGAVSTGSASATSESDVTSVYAATTPAAMFQQPAS